MKLHLPLAALLLATAGVAVAQQRRGAGRRAAAAARSRGRPPHPIPRRRVRRADRDQPAAADQPRQPPALRPAQRLYRRLSRSGSSRSRSASSPSCAASFDPARLSPAGRLSFRLFEKEVADDRAAFRWRWHGFPATNNGSPMGKIPVFLINNHRVDSVADAEAYVARLREVERVMGEIGANMRHQAELGIVPPALQLRAGARGRPPHPHRRALRRRAGQRRSSPTSRPRSAGSQIPQAEKDRLIAAARDGADRPVPPRLRSDARDARRDRAARDRQQRRLEPARRRRLITPSACANRPPPI